MKTRKTNTTSYAMAAAVASFMRSGTRTLMFTLALAAGVGGCAFEMGDLPDPSAAPDGSAVAVASAALTDCRSAHREPNVDWRQYADSCRTLQVGFAAASATVQESAVAATSVNPSVYFSQVPQWSDAVIRERFRAARDTRYMYETGPLANDPNFERRASWLFPDDGCWMRAELAASMAGDAGVVKPHKLFSFGNLEVDTSNHPDGSVTWWWHVVPVVRSSTSGEIYVLDPAIEPSQPLTWDAWLLRQVSSLNNIQVTVADANAYGPWSPVQGGPNERIDALEGMQGGFLILEWGRQVELNREPYEVLGDFPPWRRESFIDVDVGTGFSTYVSACYTCDGNEHALTERCFTQCP